MQTAFWQPLKMDKHGEGQIWSDKKKHFDVQSKRMVYLEDEQMVLSMIWVPFYDLVIICRPNKKKITIMHEFSHEELFKI